MSLLWDFSVVVSDGLFVAVVGDADANAAATVCRRLSRVAEDRWLCHCPVGVGEADARNVVAADVGIDTGGRDLALDHCPSLFTRR